MSASKSSITATFTWLSVVICSFLAMPSQPERFSVQASKDDVDQTATVVSTWGEPDNFNQFDIDYYEITIFNESTVVAKYKVQGDQTNSTRMVNLQPGITYAVNITTKDMCNMTSVAATTNVILSKIKGLNLCILG